MYYYDAGDYPNVIRTFEQNPELHQYALDSVFLLELITEAYLNMGNALQAKDILIKAQRQPSWNSPKPTPMKAMVMNNLGLFFQNQQDWDSAFYCLQQGLQWRIQMQGNQHPSVAESYFNLGSLFAEQGYYDRSEELLKRALAIDRQTFGPDDPELAMTLNNLGFVNFDCGRFDQSLPYFKEAAEIMHKSFGDDSYPYGLIMLNLGNTYMQKGNFDSANYFIDNAYRVLQENEAYVPEYGQAKIEMIPKLIHENRVEEAGKLIDDLKKEIMDKGWNSLVYELYLEESNYWLHRGNLVGAQFSTEAAHREFMSSFTTDHHGYWKIKDMQATLLMKLNDFTSAHTSFKELHTALLNKILKMFPAFSDKEREFYFQQAKPLFEKYLSLFLEPGAPLNEIASLAYNNQLATKAILLNYSNRWKRQILHSGDIELIRYYTQWQELNDQYHQIIEDLEQKHIADSLEVVINDLEKKLSVRSELFSKEIEKTPAVWQEVRDRLKPKEVAIEIIRFRSFDFKNKLEFTEEIYYAALIVTPNSRRSPELVLIGLKDELEKRISSKYRNHIRSQSEEDEETYNVLWKPIVSKLKGAKRVYISPDGIYNLINFNTFRNPRTKQYVIEELDIRRITNTRDLLHQNEIELHNKYALLMGGPDFEVPQSASVYNTLYSNTLSQIVDERGQSITPLPGARREVEIISELLKNAGWTVDLFVGSQAIEDQLKHSLKPRILHIATHGYFQQDVDYEDNQRSFQNSLLRSGLLLAGSGKTLFVPYDETESRMEDGVLTAYEAMGLNLENTELVILSACDTGLGEIQNGEGVYGLQRAFWVAGAQTLIMSLWKVDDEVTRMLMEEFYHNWLKTGSKSEAFKSAQLKIMEQYPQPYYWGSFVLVGDIE